MDWMQISRDELAFITGGAGYLGAFAFLLVVDNSFALVFMIAASLAMIWHIDKM